MSRVANWIVMKSRYNKKPGHTFSLQQPGKECYKGTREDKDGTLTEELA